MDLDSAIYWLAEKECQILVEVGIDKLASLVGCHGYHSSFEEELDFKYWMGLFTGLSILGGVMSIMGQIFSTAMSRGDGDNDKSQ